MTLFELQVVRRKQPQQIGQEAETKCIYITKPQDMLPFAREIRHHDQEHVLVISLDREHKFLAARIVHIGTMAECCVSLKDVFRGAILDNAEYIVFMHNHPGRDLMPSKSDKKMIKKLVKAGLLLDIMILDFVIVSSEGIYSVNEERTFFESKKKK